MSPVVARFEEETALGKELLNEITSLVADHPPQRVIKALSMALAHFLKQYPAFTPEQVVETFYHTVKFRENAKNAASE